MFCYRVHRRVRPAILIAAMIGLLGSVAGCGRSADDPGVRRAVTAFYGAIDAHQDRRACADLAPQAIKGLETGDSSCAEEIGKLRLNSGTIQAVHVWGDRAQVVLAGDIVFLSRFPQGWKVAAAGCRPQTKGPYDCDVEA